MPSTQVPSAVIAPSGGPTPPSGSGASANVALQAHINDPVAAHPASAISYAGGGTWADGSTNPATTTEAQLDKVITDLSGTAGTAKIGGAAMTQGTITVGAAALLAQLTSLIQAANHNYAGGAAWADGVTNPATSVETQLDKVITDLAGTAGTAKVGGAAMTQGTITIGAAALLTQLSSLIQAANHNYAGGSAWLDGAANAATNVEAQLDKIVTDLISTTAAGADKIGSKATSGTVAGSIYSILSALDTNWAKISRDITWTGTQHTFGPKVEFDNSVTFRTGVQASGVFYRYDRSTLTDSSQTITVTEDEYVIPILTGSRLLILNAPISTGQRVRFKKMNNSGFTYDIQVPVNGNLIRIDINSRVVVDLVASDLGNWVISSFYLLAGTVSNVNFAES